MKHAAHDHDSKRHAHPLARHAMWLVIPLGGLLVAVTLSRGQDPARPVPPAAPASDFPIAGTLAPVVVDATMSNDFQSLEQMSLQLAIQYRQISRTDAGEDERARVRQQLSEVVAKAFEARQAMQQRDVDQLKKRLAEIEAAVAKREDYRAEIIKDRIAALLDEDQTLQWNPNAATRRPMARFPGSVVPTPFDNGNPFAPTPIGSPGPPTLPTESVAPENPPVRRPRASQPGLPGVLSPRPVARPPVSSAPPRASAGSQPPELDPFADPDDSDPYRRGSESGDPFSDSSDRSVGTPTLPNPSGPLSSGSSGKSNIQTISDVQLTNTRRALIDTTVELERAETTYERLSKLGNAISQSQKTEARFDLEKARQHAELVRSEYDSQVQMLKLELDDAERHLQALMRDLQRTRTLHEKKVVTEAALSRAQDEQQSAIVHVERIRLLIDLHVKAGPNRSASKTGGR